MDDFQPGGAVRTTAYVAAVSRARAAWADLLPDEPVRLAKGTSNLFRRREDVTGPRLRLDGLTGVFDLDEEAGTALVGGLTTYEQLVEELLPRGWMPLVVPQLRTITIGGAVVGLGIESTSFRNGLPHESVLEADVLTGTGEVLTARAGGAHRDLLRALANSYGTLGYCLGLVIELEPTSRYVVLKHVRVSDLTALVEVISTVMAQREHEGEQVDFVDGVVFSGTEAYLTLGRWAETTEGIGIPSDYGGQQIYYRSIQHRRTDVLTAKDYLWRWDTDWFWCSRAFGAQQPRIRRLWPRRLRRSDVYWKMMAFEQRHGVVERLQRWRGRPEEERVVQDVEIPLERTAEFLTWFLTSLPIQPLWICPVRLRGEQIWPLYPMEPGQDYVNVGFWSAVPIEPGAERGAVNAAIEAKVRELGGHKGLYSTATYDEETFRQLYGGDEYARVKARYDPDGRFPTLYDKVVRAR
ncbi:MAG: FAD-binding oxidoreductase [Ornithinimicrobium sp.]|uniref:FAD-binding oxidoreductase n=1 Tax=Ornithinimicrobium sp. TaxID=1977084 RepID=UPI0026E041B9|nr:FAD-binding oxidoreductase [Ornithinimicrobium sp.]MDO5740124.1 FAD-binding oxidoreductase [Ornithinimicrobium sp.]